MRQFSIVNVVVVCQALFLLYTPLLLAADYYVSNSGNDGNPGTGPARAWKTISRVNRFKFSPGDTIRFESGGVWREQLIPHSGAGEGYITYTSYVKGNKPRLLGSVEKNKASDWKNAGVNIWSAGPFEIDVGNIIFNNGEVCGIKVWNEADLDKQNEFWYDRTNKVVKMYSTANPAQLYDDIECALTRHIINEGGKSYVIYDGLHLSYGSAHGIGGGDTHHIIVRNCDLSFIGGGHQYTKETKKGPRYVRYGNGIEFWNGAHDNIVENCRIWEIFDAALTNQGSGKNSQYNIIYRNNTIWNAGYSFEYWNRPGSSTTHDIYFEDNICFNAGAGWGNRLGAHLMFFNNSAKTYNFYVRRNVFYQAKRWGINMFAANWNGLDNLVLDDNLYYQPSDKPLVRWNSAQGDKRYFARDFKAYKKATGKDANSALIILRRLLVKPGRMKLRVNDTRKLKVTGMFSNNISIDMTDFVSYASSNEAVTSTDSAGMLKAYAPGKADITVTFERFTVTTSVRIVP